MILLLTLVAGSVIAMDTTLDPVNDYLPLYKERMGTKPRALTTSSGAFVTHTEIDSVLNSVLINNKHFMDMITHQNRERIPERINHAKGAGAFGYFEVTHDISHLCKADFLSEIGKVTPVAVRFSSSVGESGSSDLNREFRGWSIKFYTKQGNFDIPGFNTPVFFSKDPLHFVTISHAAKRNPATHLHDANAMWDAITLIPESLHMFLYVFADRGIPASYMGMPGFGIHTYQVENRKGEQHFVRFHFIPDIGIQTLGSEEAKNISASDLDYLNRGLYTVIANGEVPSWTCYVQILTEDDLERLGSDAIDVTRVLPESEFPLHPFGKVYLNRNPENYFAEVEQLAFCPANVVEGVYGGLDLLYQARRFSYKDAQLYRLGANLNKIPVNCPFRVETTTFNRDGRAPVGTNEFGRPNYYPNSFQNMYLANQKSQLYTVFEKKADNIDQIRELYENEFSYGEKSRLIENLVAALQPVTYITQERAIKLFTIISTDLGSRVAQGLNATAC